MKTTVELPDALMTQVKVLAARERRKLGEIMAELVRSGLRAHASRNEAGAQKAGERWVKEWFALGDRVSRNFPANTASIVDELVTSRREC